jgi:hypothetical protein
MRKASREALSGTPSPSPSLPQRKASREGRAQGEPPKECGKAALAPLPLAPLPLATRPRRPHVTLHSSVSSLDSLVTLHSSMQAGKAPLGRGDEERSEGLGAYRGRGGEQRRLPTSRLYMRRPLFICGGPFLYATAALYMRRPLLTCGGRSLYAVVAHIKPRSKDPSRPRPRASRPLLPSAPPRGRRRGRRGVSPPPSASLHLRLPLQLRRPRRRGCGGGAGEVTGTVGGAVRQVEK